MKRNAGREPNSELRRPYGSLPAPSLSLADAARLV